MAILKRLERNKKAIFFTAIAILIVLVMVVALRPRTQLSIEKEGISKTARIRQINDVVNEIEQIYLPDIINMVTYRALTALTYYMDYSNSYLSDLDKSFKEVFINGTINNQPIDSIISSDIMTNNTLNNWTDRLESVLGDYIDVSINFSVIDVNIGQSTPWFIETELIITYSVKSESASWDRNYTIIRSLSPTYVFDDPAYYLNTDGLYKKKVKKTSIRYNQWNNSQFKYFISNESYFDWHDGSAPSFLMRFEGDFSGSLCCGIESVVNPSKITPSDVTDSYIDYHFWNNTYRTACSRIYNVTGIWDDYPGLKLDFQEITRYNLTGYVQTC